MGRNSLPPLLPGALQMPSSQGGPAEGDRTPWGSPLTFGQWVTSAQGFNPNWKGTNQGASLWGRAGHMHLVACSPGRTRWLGPQASMWDNWQFHPR